MRQMKESQAGTCRLHFFAFLASWRFIPNNRQEAKNAITLRRIDSFFESRCGSRASVLHFNESI